MTIINTFSYYLPLESVPAVHHAVSLVTEGKLQIMVRIAHYIQYNMLSCGISIIIYPLLYEFHMKALTFQ